MLSLCTNNPCCAEVARFGILKELGQSVTHGAEIIQISFLPIQRVWEERLQGKQKSGRVSSQQGSGGASVPHDAHLLWGWEGASLASRVGHTTTGCPITDNESDTLAGSWLFWFCPRFRVDLLCERSPVLRLPFTQPLGEANEKKWGSRLTSALLPLPWWHRLPERLRSAFLLKLGWQRPPFFGSGEGEGLTF